MIPPRGMHTLVLIGDLNRASAHTLEAEIERLCEAGTSGYNARLEQAHGYFDSIGVAVIAFRCGLCQRRGYDFALIPGPWLVQRVFELACLSESLPFHEDDVVLLHLDVRRRLQPPCSRRPETSGRSILSRLRAVQQQVRYPVDRLRNNCPD